MPVLPWEPVRARPRSRRSVDHVAGQQAERAPPGRRPRRSAPASARLPSTACGARAAYVVAVDVLPRDGHEQPAGLRRPGVDVRRAGDRESSGSPCDDAADDVGDLGEGHRDHRRGRAPHATTSRSSNGCTVAGDLLAGLVALARDQHDVAGPGAVERLADRRAAGRRSRPPRRPRRAAPASTAARIAAGSSVRGLSSVTTSTSASRAAISPISGRLPGSRSPPAPMTTISRPVGERPQRPQRRLDGVGLVGVVDDDREVLAGLDPLQPARHAGAGGDPGGHRVGRRSPTSAHGGHRGQRVRHVEVAGQRDAGLDALAVGAVHDEAAARSRTGRRRSPASRRRRRSAEKVRDRDRGLVERAAGRTGRRR